MDDPSYNEVPLHLNTSDGCQRHKFKQPKITVEFVCSMRSFKNHKVEVDSSKVAPSCLTDHIE